MLVVQVHALQVEMRARFATLRDSYQHQLDTLHLQVADIEATCKLPRLPRIGDGLAAACATRGQPPASGGPGPRPAADACGPSRWDDGDLGTGDLEETPQRSRRGQYNGRGGPDAFQDDEGSGGGWHGQGLWRAEGAHTDSRYLQSVESAQGSCEVPHAAQVWRRANTCTDALHRSRAFVLARASGRGDVLAGREHPVWPETRQRNIAMPASLCRSYRIPKLTMCLHQVDCLS